jgi:hypothetical protein
MRCTRTLRLTALLSLVAIAAGATWQPAKGPLLTRWAKDVSPDKVHTEYPRPQLTRSSWMNLNGLWQCELVERAQAQPPASYQHEILVPFPVESALSGVMRQTKHLWYRRTFELPAAWGQKRLLLHFGAVDWEAQVWVNGKELGTHRGGYDGFSFDVTDALRPVGAQEIVVRVFDPTSDGDQPRGKQVDKPGGIFYTPTTGIWQTVWLEPVSAGHVERLDMTPDLDGSQLKLTVVGAGTGDQDGVEVLVKAGKDEVARVTGKPGAELKIALPDFKRWTPNDPFLYDLEVALTHDGKVADRVESYFGMRKIELGPDDMGRQRIKLNGEALFQVGPLDQGFWPDGLYTAPTDEALRYDVEVTKQLGFNMTRKHVKVEPDRWYYWCDKLGLLVWQDMPSGDNKTPESHKQYELELDQMVAGRRNHPSIVLWVVFNEGWGQFDTERLTQHTKQLDPSRLVSNASGWTDMKVGDVMDIHSYPGPAAPDPESARAGVLGEFGGLGLAVNGHTWEQKTWGYQGTKNTDELTSRYQSLLRDAWALQESKGMSAAVYTQITDVETEANGLLTYDREVFKVDRKRAKAANRGRFPELRMLAATSERQPQTWSYVFAQPGENWAQPGFDASAWKSGPGGFGTKITPGAVVGTVWDTADIWLRREFDVPDRKFEEVVVRLHHDEDVTVYLNGVKVLELKDYTSQYGEQPLSSEGLAALKPGKNVLAVHCHQTGGGQYLDVGLAELLPLAQAPGKKPWVSLFDGKSLGKWKPTDFAGHSDVEVKDGQLVLSFGSELTGVTWTGELPRMNYEIALDAMRVDGSDFFCGLTFPVGDSPCSLIVGGWGGGVVGLSSLNGKDAARNDTTQYVEFQKGRWYHIKLRVTEHRIQAWIDKRQVIDADTTDKTISIRGEVEKSRPLGICSYSTTAALKDIKIREVPQGEAKSAK